mmetsp:Transcript_1417/g.3404  ORF Transcript_1417/g.3404 Transcript_1417/m.3404 type:complete len:225 (+) Transcript_1417:1093-1767(+)
MWGDMAPVGRGAVCAALGGAAGGIFQVLGAQQRHEVRAHRAARGDRGGGGGSRVRRAAHKHPLRGRGGRGAVACYQHTIHHLLDFLRADAQHGGAAKLCSSGGEARLLLQCREGAAAPQRRRDQREVQLVIGRAGWSRRGSHPLRPGRCRGPRRAGTRAPAGRGEPIQGGQEGRRQQRRMQQRIIRLRAFASSARGKPLGRGREVRQIVRKLPKGRLVLLRGGG